MPFDGSGNFNRNFPPGGWQGDAAANIKIMADRHDTHDKDLADGLTNCMTKDGQSQPTANIPMNGKRLVNMADPVNPDDAATKKFVETITGWTTSKTISGADLNGRLIFSGTGVTGIQWTAADLFWGAKVAKASETSHRIVLNDKADATGTDVFAIDDAGRINNSGVLTNNLSYDGAAWRTISPGIGTQLTYTGGRLNLNANDTATITNPYVSTTLRNAAFLANSAGNAQFGLMKSASGKSNQILAYSGTTPTLRWQLQMGDGVAEGGSTLYTGSNFVLTGYRNDGTLPLTRMHIARDTGNVTFYGTVTGASNFDSTSTTCILSATTGGAIYFRPNGPTSTVEQWQIDTAGNFMAQGAVAAAAGGIYAGRGLRAKAGYQGGYGANWMNLYYVSPDVRVYVDSSYIGDIYWQVPSDYRIKKDVQPLPSLWNAVKALKPISYKHKQFKHIEADDKVRWGFSAHEMQEALGDIAATGVKDDPEIVQRPDQWLLVTALTKALQEAMARIEALEAAA